MSHRISFIVGFLAAGLLGWSLLPTRSSSGQDPEALLRKLMKDNGASGSMIETGTTQGGSTYTTTDNGTVLIGNNGGSGGFLLFVNKQVKADKTKEAAAVARFAGVDKNGKTWTLDIDESAQAITASGSFELRVKGHDTRLLIDGDNVTVLGNLTVKGNLQVTGQINGK